MWQMTWDEILTDESEPYGKTNRLNGITDWFCPVCKYVVGIYSDGSVHNEGWLFKQSTCKNGHRIKWSK